MKQTKNRPEPLSLASIQRETLGFSFAQFRDYTQSDQFRRDQDHRKIQLDFFQREFPLRFAELAESDVLDLVKHLWAAQIFGNKQYLAQKIVLENGLGELRENFRRLWDANVAVATRYDEFRNNISYLGPAAITEIMCNIEPQRCGIWNAKARQALRILGLGDFVNPDQYQITGAEYENFNRLLAAIAAEMEKDGLGDSDLLYVDYFLYSVAEAARQQSAPPPPPIASTHDEVRDMIFDIGAMLGFETSKEVSITHGAKVDVVWRVRIGNLGTVTYVFEVQSSGSIDSLILNLQRAKSDPTVQKVIAVSDEQQLQRIERETSALPSEFRNALALWNISEVQQVNQNLQAAMTIINKLGLAPGKD